ncbi:MATE family efflux transporter [Nonomuraea sp. NPDC004580]|uniref:MATE family efflux transporter n=1 Tax=Nonomuraea sp. NPDC004580 TaxID=3154552 RepID=UPI0033B10DCE
MSSSLRVVLSAALPLLLSMSAGVVAQLLGTSLLGRQATAELAAFTLASAVLSPVTAAVAGGLRGMSPFVAACRDRPAEALAVLKDARWLTLALGTAGAGVVLAVPLIARAGGAPEAAIAELGALPALLAGQVLLSAAGSGAGGMLIALRHSRKVLWSGLSGTAAQVVLLLALVPAYGVQGTGVAMVTATAVQVVISNVLLLRLPELAGQSWWPGRPRGRRILRMARVGLPLSATLIVKFTVMGGVAYAAARTGVHQAAAHAILLSLDGLLGLAAFAAAQAVTPEVARASSPRAARRLILAAVTVAAGGVAAGAVVVLVAGDVVLRLFTQDAAVFSLALGLAPLLVTFSLVSNCAIVTAYGLVGLKRSSWQLAAVGTGYGLLALAMVPAATAWGLAGVWGAMIAAAALTWALQITGFVRHSAALKPAAA